MVVYAVYLVLGLVGLGALAILLFGIRKLTYGGVNGATLVLTAIPMVLLVVLGFVLGDWSLAGIWTVLISLALTTLSLFMSGIRGLLGF